MNTVYDAPLAAGLKVLRTTDLLMSSSSKKNIKGKLKIGFDGRMLAISTEDPFWLFKKDRLFSSI